MICIVDLGIGNHANVARASGGVVTDDPYEIARSDKLIIPGVGSAASVSGKLEELRDSIMDRINDGTPVLGICLGMQLLLTKSREGNIRGLDVFPGVADRFKSGISTHIGWNTVSPTMGSRLMEGIPDGSFFYFVHSYRVLVDEKYVVASTEYEGETFPSVISRDNVAGVQFHPEKSSTAGKRILSNFSMKGVTA